VFVPCGKLLLRPAPCNPVDNFLADDTRAPLHRPHALPGRRYAGSRQNIVKLGEKEIVPGCVKSPCARFTFLGICTIHRDNALALRQQMLAVSLLLLDIVHHAVAAREGMLQFGCDNGQCCPVGNNRVSEGLRRAKA
jgi:hypothetical protein